MTPTAAFPNELADHIRLPNHRDPERFQVMMIPAVLEKLVYVITLTVLYVQGRLAAGQFALAGPDLALGILFIVSFFRVEDARRRKVWSAGYPV
ncbi:MAG TPA: hypothetical protein VK504_16515 [Vicinamibacterales bacterium]|jgi:hypothetical protein|nr:hypothetical protein [Vicinamibacterales bacterium]